MLPLIGKSIFDFGMEQWSTFLAERRANRKITPGRAPRSKTLASLAKAWNIPIDRVKAAVESLQREKGTSNVQGEVLP